jgi:hypothetical protein
LGWHDDLRRHQFARLVLGLLAKNDQLVFLEAGGDFDIGGALQPQGYFALLDSVTGIHHEDGAARFGGRLNRLQWHGENVVNGVQRQLHGGMHSRD